MNAIATTLVKVSARAARQKRVLLPHLGDGSKVITLHRREREVALLLLTGHSAKEIAEDLEVAVSTVRGRIGALCRHASLSTRDELVVWLVQNMPGCLVKGSPVPVGLHPWHCICGSALCTALRLISGRSPGRV